MQLCDCSKNNQIEQFFKPSKLCSTQTYSGALKSPLNLTKNKHIITSLFVLMYEDLGQNNRGREQSKGMNEKKYRRGVTRVIVSREAH